MNTSLVEVKVYHQGHLLQELEITVLSFVITFLYTLLNPLESSTM